MLNSTEYEHILGLQTDAFEYDIQKRKHMPFSVFVIIRDLYIERTNNQEKDIDNLMNNSDTEFIVDENLIKILTLMMNY